MLLVIMLNRSRFVYSVLHSLLSLFAFSLDHLTTTYVVSSRTARPNRFSLYHLTVFVFLVVTAAHTLRSVSISVNVLHRCHNEISKSFSNRSNQITKFNDDFSQLLRNVIFLDVRLSFYVDEEQ